MVPHIRPQGVSSIDMDLEPDPDRCDRMLRLTPEQVSALMETFR